MANRPRRFETLGSLAAALLLVVATLSLAKADEPPESAFGAPEPVRLLGYAGDAMEPFLSRDGGVLLFNNRNHPPERTDLHWASRIDALTFRYRGKIEGANSDQLDGVPTMSGRGEICFVSTRSYFETFGTVFCGDWRDGRVERVSLQAGASRGVLGRLVFDIEASPSGDMLILADGLFTGGPVPEAADLRLARLTAEGFRLSPPDDALFDAINTDALEYAAALSANELDLAFTRLDGGSATIWLARRDHPNAAFGRPGKIASIDGFAEAPTFSPDGRSIYFHRRIRGRFQIWRVTSGPR